MKTGKIIKVAGPLVVAEGMKKTNVYNIIYASNNKLIGKK